jgi:hypothetical protein
MLQAQPVGRAAHRIGDAPRARLLFGAEDRVQASSATSLLLRDCLQRIRLHQPFPPGMAKMNSVPPSAVYFASSR